MLNSNNTADLLGMEDVLIKKVETSEHLVTISVCLPRKEHCCPRCHNMTSHVHDYRTQKVHDLDSFGKEVLLLYRKRRYICPVCGKRFYEHSPIVRFYQRNTQRMFLEIVDSFRKKISATDIAEAYHVSVTTAFRYFNILSFRNHSLPSVLSIDEFKGNSGGEKYNCIIADAQRNQVLDILKTRKESDLIQYFCSFPNRENVKFVSIDMNGHFDRVARSCFPHAKIIADRYHVIRQVFWAMENVRKREQKKLSKQYRIYFKHSKYLLSKRPELLSDIESDRLSVMFRYAPDLGMAYRLKNNFIDVMSSPNAIIARPKLADWIINAEFQNIPEFKSCITCYRNWLDEILNSFDYRYSNGFVEGCNNKIKVLKRLSFGMRNFDNFRKRILFLSIKNVS